VTQPDDDPMAAVTRTYRSFARLEARGRSPAYESLNPLDVTSDDDVCWLSCLVWPGEGDRAPRLADAIASARRDPPAVHRGDLVIDLPGLAAQVPSGATPVIYQTSVLYQSGSAAGASTTRKPSPRCTRRARPGSKHPFREPEPGYLARIREEDSAQCQFGTPIVDGDRAAVCWSAQTQLTDGTSEDLAGVSLLRFSAAGLVVEERDFWNQR
jgi:Uncharacterized protein conserved in bacteria (DUF2332)